MQSKSNVQDSKYRESSFKTDSNFVINIVLASVRAQLEARGGNSIRGLSRQFRLLDSYNGNRKVDPQEFYVGLQENGVKITKAESDVRYFTRMWLLTIIMSVGTHGLL